MTVNFLFAVFLLEILMYLRYILVLLIHKQNYEISTVDCTQIKDLNNLCVRPTFVCKQTKLGLDSLRYRYGRNDV